MASQMEILRLVLERPGITRPELDAWHRKIQGSQIDSKMCVSLYTNRYVSREKDGRTFRYTITADGIRKIQNGENIIT